MTPLDDKPRNTLLSRIACAGIALCFAGSAEAQEYAQRRNLLDMLFGGPRYERDQEYEPPQPPRYNRGGDSIIEMGPRRERNRGNVRASAPREPAPPEPVKPEPVAKLDDARKILIVGDFLAGGMGGELETTFEASPGVAVIERSDVSSGLVRTDHYDWPKNLPGMIDEVKPAMVVVMIGTNDRQQITDDDLKEKFRTDGWYTEYEKRVAKLAGIVADRKLPLLWVGLPAFQSPSMTADAVNLNAIYRAQIEKAGGEFVDIWDGFVDEDGKFVTTGSDVSGQQVRLRGSDGITFTKAGKQKIAFYVEKFVRRHLGDIAVPDVATLPAAGLTPLPGQPAHQAPTVPISFVDPELDGGKTLLGGAAMQVAPAETPRNKLVSRGEMDQAPAGRVDNYKLQTSQ